jgi:hypothetical protein
MRKVREQIPLDESSFYADYERKKLKCYVECKEIANPSEYYLLYIEVLNVSGARLLQPLQMDRPVEPCC